MTNTQDSPPTLCADERLARVHEYYVARRERLATNLDRQQLLALRSVPFLLHMHESNFPGYRDGGSTPYGIAGGVEDEMLESDWSTLFQHAYRETPFDQPDILTLALGGDAGTHGQGPETLFPFWVVVGDALSDQALVSLQWKCDAIGDWLLKGFRLSSAFYVIRQEEFKANAFPHVAATKGTNDAPLVRDRLLASLFVIAGKTIAFHASTADESDQVDPSQVLDLGGLQAFEAHHLAHYVMRMIENLMERPAEIVVPLAHVLATHNSPGMAQAMLTRIFNSPSQADPFDLQMQEVDQSLSEIDARFLSYFRQVSYIKTNPYLSRKQQDTQTLEPIRKRMSERVATWKWSPLMVMSLDNITLWNYPQLREFHHSLAHFVEWVGETLSDKIRQLENADDAQMIQEKLDRALITFRHTPGKVAPVTPYSRLYYASSNVLFKQEQDSQGKILWKLVMNVPMARDLTAPSTELTLRESRVLLPLILWMTRVGMLSAKSLLKVEAMEAEISSKWAQDLLAACVKLCSTKSTSLDADRREGVHFLLTANLNHELASAKERAQAKSEVRDASRKMRSAATTSTAVISEAKVYDYEGAGAAVLKDFSLAYVNRCGEVFAHHFAYRHHALAQVFAFLASKLKYDDSTKTLNIDFLVPPNAEGLNIRMALQLTLFEMSKFFNAEYEGRRRFVTRHRGICYVYEKESHEQDVRLKVCSNVLELLGHLEETESVATEVNIDKQVVGLERMRDLFAHAQRGALDLYVFRDTEPYQLHLIDEFGSFYSDRVPGENAFGLIGDMVAVLDHYAERHGLTLNIHDVTRREGRVMDYVISEAMYTQQLREKRSSPFVLAFREADPDNPTILRVHIGDASTTASLSPELLSKLSGAARKAGGASIVDLPRVIEFSDGERISVESGATALRAAKAIRNMLLG